MNVLQKITFVSNKNLLRSFCVSKIVLAKPETSTDNKKSAQTFDILDELRKPELTEEEITRKRFKARLPERLYRTFVKKEALPIEAKYDFKLVRLRKYYARHGSDSKLNPGICWPTREEILETMEYDLKLDSTLQENMKKVEEARIAKENHQKEIEAEVDKNMANLDKWIADYNDKIEKKKGEVAELRLKKERLIEEISEYLGYDIDPRDPRFQEAVEQRDKEKKKALKVKKAQESYDKMVARLKQMAEKSTT